MLLFKALKSQEKNGSEPNSEKSANEKDRSYYALTVKAKQKDRKYALLKRLMLLGLKPSLRMAALKMLMCKKKKISLCDLNSTELEGKKIMFVYYRYYKNILHR